MKKFLDLEGVKYIINKVIGKTDISGIGDGTLKGAISSIKSLVGEKSSELSQEIDVERKRINNFTKLAEGSTTGDAELVDMRVGVDGKEYDSAGEAVRGQVGELKEDIDNLEPIGQSIVLSNNQPRNIINKNRLKHGCYWNEGKLVKDEKKRWNATKLIPIVSGKKLYAELVGLSCFWKEDGTFVQNVRGEELEKGLQVPDGVAYISCSILNENTANCILSYSRFLKNDSGIIQINKNKDYTEGWIKFEVQVNSELVKQDDSGSGQMDKQIYNKVDCVLKLPETYTAYGTPSKLMMLCHGAGRGVTVKNTSDGKSWIELDAYNNLVETFVANGYSVFDCNGYDNTMEGSCFWGAPKGIEAWRKAYDYVTDNYNVETTFSLFGFSMGGLTACNLVMNGFPNIKCVALASPVLDLRKCWEDGQIELMRKGYGMTDSYDEKLSAGSNPMSHLVTIDKTEYCLSKFPPIKIWYGSTEMGIAVNKEYAKRLVNAIKNSGGYAVYREVANAGHEICYGEKAACNTEYYIWVNRFNNNYYN